MEDIIIIKTKIDYVESFCKAVDTVAKERKYLASTEGFPLESVKSFVEMIQENDLAQYYLVKDGIVIGWCDILPKSFEGMKHVGNLGMGLLANYRGKGLGSRLLETTMQHAKSKNGIEKIELEVFESNINAIRLYNKYGFIQEGKRFKARKLDGKYDNIILMGKFL